MGGGFFSCDFSGAKVVITGATGGIGSSCVNKFLSYGASVVATSTSVEKLKKLKSSVCESLLISQDRMQVLEADFSTPESSIEVIEKSAEFFGGIDILICNAGITRDQLAVRMTKENWSDVINVNLNSVFYANKSAGKLFFRQKHGKIINISSIVASTGNVGQANYCASKGGVEAMSKALSIEFAKFNTTVNCIAPGFIETNMTNDLKSEHKDEIKSRILLGRFGIPEDVSNVVCFLSSNAASYLTGQTIHVNGGMLVS